nr:polyprotein [Rubber tree latent virus 1]
MALSGILSLDPALQVDFCEVTTALDDLSPNVLYPHTSYQLCTEPELLWGRYSFCRLTKHYFVSKLVDSYKTLVCVKNAISVNGVRDGAFFSYKLFPGDCVSLDRVESLSYSPGIPFSMCDFIVLRNQLPLYINTSNALVTSNGYCYLHLFDSPQRDCTYLFAIAQRFGKYPYFKDVYNHLYSLNVREVPVIVKVERDLYHVFPQQRRQLSEYSYILDLPGVHYIGGDTSGFNLARSAQPMADVSVHLSPESTALLDVVGLVSEESKSSFVKSLLLDNHCFTRKTIDEKLSKDLSNVRGKRGRPSVVIHNVLSHEEFKHLESDYPEFTIKFEQDVKTPHAYAAASRKLAHSLIFKEIGFRPDRVMSNRHMVDVIDIGGNWYSHIVADRPRVHCCCPILSVQDDVRETTRRRFFSELSRPVEPKVEREIRKLRSIEYFENPKTRWRIRCLKKAQYCPVTAPVATMIHSAYDMTTEEIADSMTRHKCAFLMGVIMFTPEIIIEEKGILPWLDCQFDRSRGDGMIHFNFRGEASFGYSHKWENYRELLSKKVWWNSEKSQAYVCQLLLNRTGEQYFSVTLLNNPQIPHSKLNHRVWFDNSEQLVVKFWSFDVRASTLQKAMVPKQFICDRWTADKIMTYALRQTTEAKFNAAEIFSYAVAIDSKVIVDGTTVMRGKQTKPVELFDLAHAIYIQAYVQRYNSGRVDKAVLDGIKAERELSSAGLFKKFTMLFRKGGSNGYLTRLHDLLNHWVVLPELFPVSISKAIEYVQFDEIVEPFLNPPEVSQELERGPLRPEPGAQIRATLHLAESDKESGDEDEDDKGSNASWGGLLPTPSRGEKRKSEKPLDTLSQDSGSEEKQDQGEKYRWQIEDIQEFSISAETWSLDSYRNFYLVFRDPVKELHLHRGTRLLIHSEVKSQLLPRSLVVELTPCSPVPIEEIVDGFKLLSKVEIRDLFELGLIVLNEDLFSKQSHGPYKKGLTFEEFVQSLLPLRRAVKVGRCVGKTVGAALDSFAHTVLPLAGGGTTEDSTFNKALRVPKKIPTLHAAVVLKNPPVQSSKEEQVVAADHIAQSTKEKEVVSAEVKERKSEISDPTKESQRIQEVVEIKSSDDERSTTSEVEPMIISSDSEEENSIVKQSQELVVTEQKEVFYGPEIPPENSTWQVPINMGKCQCGDHWRISVKADGNCFYYSLKRLLPFLGSVEEMKEIMKEGLHEFDYGVARYLRRILDIPFHYAEPACVQLAANVFERDLWIHESFDSPGIQIIKSSKPAKGHLCILLERAHFTPLLCHKEKVLWSEVVDVPSTTSESDSSIQEKESKREEKKGMEVIQSNASNQERSYYYQIEQLSNSMSLFKQLHRTKPTLIRNFPTDSMVFPFLEAKRLRRRKALFYCANKDWVYGHDKVIYQNGGWPEDIARLADRFRCNSVLIQIYEKGATIPPHKDDEAVYDLGDNPVFTVNFLGSAKFSFGENKKELHSVDLSAGDLLVMPPAYQKKHFHSVESLSEGRISLTFRRQKRNLSGYDQTTVAEEWQKKQKVEQKNTEVVKEISGGGTWGKTCKRSTRERSHKKGLHLEKFSNTKTYSEIYASELKHLSEIEQRRWAEFSPKLNNNDLKNEVHRNLVNALGEVMEYWRVHDEVLRRRLRDIYVRIPTSIIDTSSSTVAQLKEHGPNKKDVEAALKRNGIKTFEVSIWDTHHNRWLWQAEGIHDYEGCFDGESILEIPMELKADLDKTKDPREYTSLFDMELPFRWLLLTKETVLLQSGKFYKVAMNEVKQATDWVPPLIDFVQGVPGCGKTSYILRNHKRSVWPPFKKILGERKYTRKPSVLGDLVLTTTREGAHDIRKRLRDSGEEVYDKQYRTLDSYILNCSIPFEEVWVDEALMQHAGALVLVALKTRCKVLHLMGDRAQIDFIPRMGDVTLRFCSMGDLVPTSKILNTTYRCPVDVAAILSEHYEQGMVSTSKVRESMKVERITDAGQVPKEDDATYLTFKQAEKFELVKKGFKNVHTIHEFQGLQTDKVYIVRTSHKPAEEIYSSMGHILVAMSRHRELLVYFTPVLLDSLAKKMLKRPTAAQLQAASLQVDVPSKSTRGGFSTLFPVAEEKKIQSSTPLSTSPIESLQTWYDDTCPGEATFVGIYDQQMVFDADLAIAVGKSGIDVSRVRPLKNSRPTLRPNLRTSMQPIRRSGVKETLLAYFKRNANVPSLSGDVDPEELSQRMVEIFEESYLDKNLKTHYASMRLERIGCNSKRIQKWMDGHSDFTSKCEWPPSIYEHANDLYRYMVKRTVKPAFDGTNMSEYKAVQTIAYLAKDVNAVFCPIVREMTERLQSVLDRRFILFSMMSPEEFASRMETLIEPRNVHKYFKKEVDFSKYDKSQGEVLHLFEKKMYARLGFSGELADLYWAAHVYSKYKDFDNGFDAGIWFQRRTGDAATFLGNTLVVMGVLACVFNMQETHAGAFAGDDSILFSTEDIYSIDKSFIASQLFNLESKFFTFKSVYFCSKFLLNVNDRFVFLPDPMKLVTKLGRTDLVDWIHLEEYYTSIKDLCKEYSNFCIEPSLSAALKERYPRTHNSSGYLISALWSVLKDFESFSQLFSEPPEGLLIDPSRPNL